MTKDSAPNRVNETELVIELDSFLETAKLKYNCSEKCSQVIIKLSGDSLKTRLTYLFDCTRSESLLEKVCRARVCGR